MSILAHLQYDQPDISIVVPAFNEENYIAQTLWSLSKNTPSLSTEVIVVDNGSTDRTAYFADISGAKVIREPKK